MNTASLGCSYAAILSLALAATAAVAGPVIYDNGGIVSAYGSNLEQFVLADDFVLVDGGVVADAGLYVGSTTGDLGGWDGTLAYWILADADGSPGSILTSGPGQNITTTQTHIAWCCNGNAWLFEFDLATPFDAAAGVTYWFGVHLAAGFDENVPATLFWLGNGESGNMHQNHLGTFENWDEEAFADVAFFLTTTAEIPEPGSLALLVATLLGFGLRRRCPGGYGRPQNLDRGRITTPR